jgi:hypothetical protein
LSDFIWKKKGIDMEVEVEKTVRKRYRSIIGEHVFSETVLA